MRKLLSALPGIIAAFFLLWLFLSWCDVVTDNLQEHPEHSKYNAFAVLVELGEGANQ